MTLKTGFLATLGAYLVHNSHRLAKKSGGIENLIKNCAPLDSDDENDQEKIENAKQLNQAVAGAVCAGGVDL